MGRTAAMNGTRLGSLVTGVALIGLGAMVAVRAIGARDAAGTPGERNPRATIPYGDGSRIVKVFTIERPAHDLYAFWRDFSNLPAIMPHLDRVEVDGDRSHWHATTNAGIPATWSAEIVADVPDERIAWRSVGGAFRSAGSVTFAPAPGDRGTEVRIEMMWSAPGGGTLLSLLGQDPALAVESDLRRFKSLMEAGDVALNGTDVKR